MGSLAVILLDTHIWIWGATSSERLSKSLRRELEAPDAELAISSISVWEAVMALERGRIKSATSAEQMVREWIKASPAAIVPVDEDIAFLARSLAFTHPDPADRFIAATAYKYDCQLATADARLRSLPWLKCIG